MSIFSAKFAWFWGVLLAMSVVGGGPLRSFPTSPWFEALAPILPGGELHWAPGIWSNGVMERHRGIQGKKDMGRRLTEGGRGFIDGVTDAACENKAQALAGSEQETRGQAE